LRDRLGFKKKDQPAEIIGMRPEVLQFAQGGKKEDLWPAAPKVPRPVQQIPSEEVESLLRSRKKIEEPKPAEDIKKLLDGEVKLPIKAKPLPKPVMVAPRVETKVEETPQLATPEEVEPEQPQEEKPHEGAKAPLFRIIDWVKSKSVKREKTPVAKKIVASTESINTDKAEVTKTDVAGAKPKEFVPDPPLQKGKKKIPETLKEKKKAEEKKPKRKLSYEEAVEEYERQLASGKKPVVVAKIPGAPPVATVVPPRFSRAEINKMLMIKVMPSFIRSVLAKRSGVPFMVMCGIYKYEFIQIVKDKEEGFKIMRDLKDALNYESIVESYPRRTREVFALYSRAVMEHRGRYSGTPLHPRLEERF